MSRVIAVSLQADQGGNSSVISLSAVSAQSAVLNGEIILVTPTVDCFFRAGTSPVAVADGTDTFLLGNNSYRIRLQAKATKLAFITSGSAGNVYLTPGA